MCRAALEVSQTLCQIWNQRTRNYLLQFKYHLLSLIFANLFCFSRVHRFLLVWPQTNVCTCLHPQSVWLCKSYKYTYLLNRSLSLMLIASLLLPLSHWVSMVGKICMQLATHCLLIICKLSFMVSISQAEW